MPLEHKEQVADPTKEQPINFQIDRFAFLKAAYELIPKQTAEEGEKRPRRVPLEIQINASIHKADGVPLRALVTLDVKVTPDPKWQPYRINIIVMGGFSVTNGTPELLDQFCRIGVPPILFPYVREKVHSLTMDAPNGVVRIDPINLAQMSSQANWIDASRESAD